MPSPKFSNGGAVQRVNEPDAIGIVVQAQYNEQFETWTYQVQFGGSLKGVPENMLMPFQRIESIWEAWDQHHFSGIEHFQCILTYHRLRRPPSRIANSFSTARTDFYPYQFKPLLKFLDHPSKRILIADEVGLGKTIEAGYILKEIRAHRQIDRVVILVPSRLRSKWRKELATRFDEHFDIIKKDQLLDAALRFAKGSEPEAFKWIISYESARKPDLIKIIEETQLPIDVLIADEVHRMRNINKQHQIGEQLSACADIAIFLSATPVQNKIGDIYNILNILSPEEFMDSQIFESQMEANQFILQAQIALNRKPPEIEEILASLKGFASTDMGRRLADKEFFQSIISRVVQFVNSRSERISLQADISTLSPLSHVMTRTKKRDVMPNAPTRQARWKSVELGDLERQIYDQVVALCKITGMGGTSQWGQQMSLVTAYRVMASSIPAACKYFLDKLGGKSAPGWDIEEQEDEEEVFDGIENWQTAEKHRLSELLGSYRSENFKDSKYDELRAAMQGAWDEDRRSGRALRKIIVFSYFPRTLDYLSDRLRNLNIPHQKIHGGVTGVLRDKAIDRFVDEMEMLVLLTSDVGGEGIDLQCASVLINYDLPWNPMVVEQRIGRIDRIGQNADALIIINMVTKDSIEERVLGRLLDKIEIFKYSIGEPDPIIGQKIEKLTREALSGALTDEELDQKVESVGNALHEQVNDARRVMESVDKMLASDQGLIDEIQSITQERQVPLAHEILLFLNRFMASNYSGYQLPVDSTRKEVSCDFRGALAQDLEKSVMEIDSLKGRAFALKAQGAPVRLTLSREIAHRHVNSDLVHFRHPLVLFAVSKYEKTNERRQAAFCLSVPSIPGLLEQGIYGFLIMNLEIASRRPSTRMIIVLVPFRGGSAISDHEKTIPILLHMLENGISSPEPSIDGHGVAEVKKRLISELERLRHESSERERKLDEIRYEQQSATLRATLELRLKKAKERHQKLLEGNKLPLPLRLAEAKIRKANDELSTAMERSISLLKWKEPESEEVAAGILIVEERTA
jgi:superfamily II DNA or RNA helicase